MVTADRTKDQAMFYGLSTDEKPSGADVANGACFLEMDTATIWFYDADAGQWRAWQTDGWHPSEGGDPE